MAIQRAKKCHDYPMNTYAQRSNVQICSHLLSLYDLHWCQETDLQHTPLKMHKDSSYYELAVQSSQALKQAMAAHAFPPDEKPQLKERVQVLQAVMGKDLTPADLKRAYNKETNPKGGRGRGRGGGGGYRGRGNGRGRGFGRGRGRGQGRGRGRNNNQDFADDA